MPRLCPDCQLTLTRIRRKSWMRCIPGSKHYLCRECGYAYLLILNRWLVELNYYTQKPDSSKRF